jgi:hypothetical protein
VSSKFDLKVVVRGQPDPGDPNLISGPATVEIYRKGKTNPFQKLEMANLMLSKDQRAVEAIGKANPSEPDNEYSFVFADFNFDNRQDLAICNGNHSGYGLPSYDVFLYDPKLHKFVKSGPFSKLAQEHLGLFVVNPKRKSLTVSDKSGAAWHETTVYRVKKNLPVLIERITDDATGAKEVITDRRQVGSRWVVRVTRRAIKP